MPDSLLVLQNDPDKPLGRIADGLARIGIPLDVRSPQRDLPPVREYAGLVVLPGLADPVDEDPPVQRARDAINASLDAELPILGLCLGGQLLVQALGGSVHPCPPELGFGDVVASPAASTDPLLGGAPERFSIFHAHAFAFEPPADAEILLSNDLCVQACRVGRTWAFQCHPEVSHEWVAALASGIRGQDGGLLAATASFFARSGVDPDRLEHDAALAESALSTVASGIATGYAAQLG